MKVVASFINICIPLVNVTFSLPLGLYLNIVGIPSAAEAAIGHQW